MQRDVLFGGVTVKDWYEADFRRLQSLQSILEVDYGHKFSASPGDYGVEKLREIAKDREFLKIDRMQEFFALAASLNARLLAEKQRLDEAVDCLELAIKTVSGSFYHLQLMDTMEYIFTRYEMSDPLGVEFKRVYGDIGKKMSQLQNMKEDTEGSGGSLIMNVIAAAFFAALAGALWLYPPVYAWFTAHIFGAMTVVGALLCIVTLVATGGSIIALIVAAVLCALAGAGYREFVPESLQLPLLINGSRILITLLIIVLGWLLLAGAFARNLRAAREDPGIRRANRRKFQEIVGSIEREVSILKSRPSVSVVFMVNSEEDKYVWHLIRMERNRDFNYSIEDYEGHVQNFIRFYRSYYEYVGKQLERVSSHV